MSSREEANRSKVAKDVEYTVYGMWPGCKVEVFGRSLSLYGSSNSDVDMSVLTKGPCRGRKLSNEMLGFYYLKRLPDRKIWDEEKKGTMVDTDIGQMKRVRLQAFDGIGKLFTSKDPKQPDNAAFFEMQMELLDEAVTSLLDHIYEQARLDGEPVTSSRAQPVAKLLRESKRRKNELFYLKSTLEAEPEFKVQSLTSHARVPVIRFQYTQGGLDYKWDLCFDNKLGLRNTRLLRAYTS
ncbi:putative Poly(A) polymerase [Phytophthora cinnamomi]|uniref:putative Poly(A) polymerase n=1 Tax=Phytophthora cinnamomi TaxID=4785 RepID=UPI00355A3E3D|nr:putative Poly(A) polymerase [Phytophthora cinnamomi]